MYEETNVNAASAWQYDEFRQVGKDYDSAAEVEVYDETHADFRDIERESEETLDRLGLEPGQVLIEFGCGTGTLAICAARRGLRVHAVDVSETMLARAKAKAERAGVSGIEFHHAGFLTYRHAGPPADGVTTSLALHHLPDFWKGIALQRIHGLMVPGARLSLYDVIIEDKDPVATIQAFIDQQEVAGGDFLREDAEIHFRDEFSTYDWVMEGLLERAGFVMEEKSATDGVLVQYCCRK